MATGLFRDTTVFYPDSAPDYTSIKNVIQDQGGRVVTQLHLATLVLLPSGGARAHPSGEFVDVSYLYDSIEAGRPLETEEYIVSFSLPEPYAARRKLARDTGLTLTEVRARSRSRSPNRNMRNSSSPEMATRMSSSDVQPRPMTPRQQGLPPPTPRSSEQRKRPIYRNEHPSIFRGRLFFTHEDDMRIVHFIEDHRGVFGHSANGVNLWKKAEQVKLLGPARSWQAYEGRWKKTIRIRWDWFHQRHMEWMHGNGLQMPSGNNPTEFWRRLPEA